MCCKEESIIIEDWRQIKVEGINSIEKKVAEYHIWSIEKIPYGKFKVKILEHQDGEFFGFPNLAVRSIEDGSPDWIGGMGNTIDEALKDTLKYFMKTLEGRENLTEKDFEWSAHEDF